MVKIRLGSDKQLHSFDSQSEAFAWAKNQLRDVESMVSVLSYNNGSLESMERYHYNGARFIRENVQS